MSKWSTVDYDNGDCSCPVVPCSMECHLYCKKGENKHIRFKVSPIRRNMFALTVYSMNVYARREDGQIEEGERAAAASQPLPRPATTYAY